MTHELRVYRDNDAGAVIFKESSFGERFTNVLSATQTDEGTIDVTDVHTGKMLIAGIAYTSIKRRDGSDAGATTEETINYLNAEFAPAGAGGGLPPAITSTLAVSVVAGSPFNYTITATNAPVYYDADNLPTGLVINHFTGVIFGTTTVEGDHPVSLTAVNGFGVDIEVLILSVLAAGGFTSTVATRFKDSFYKNYIEVTTSPAIERSSGQPWSVSMWLHLDALADQDLWSFGTQSNYIYCGVTAAGSLVVRFRRSNTSILEMTFGAIAPLGWHHVVFTNDGTNTPAGVHVYVDGLAQAQTVVVNTLDGVAGGTSNFRIARATGSVGSAEWLDGYLDEWSYYSVELDAVAVAALYNGGAPVDLSGLGSAASLQVWYRMGDGDTFPTLTDHSVAGIHEGVMKNMTVANFVNFVP